VSKKQRAADPLIEDGRRLSVLSIQAETHLQPDFPPFGRGSLQHVAEFGG